ncbi:MAG: NACHT domain-containing protein [Chloroflexi bacterium]|nr:NACHT domain-containing protein [Chloroflexota bacterium]MBI3339353.1 NACHT domain-containing protein [Chloroflexota bacterium]
MKIPFLPPIDPFSFIFAFIVASLFWWLVGRARPLWNELRENLKTQSEEAQARRTTSVEENHRRLTLRRAQGMHLAAPLFALDEILQEPRLLAPPAHVEPGGPIATEDIVTQTLPYLPAWPELGAAYNAPTLSFKQALSGGVNLAIIGQPGIGKTVALAHLATLAANRDDRLGHLNDLIPFLIHVADIKLPINETRDILHPINESVSEHASVLDLGRVPGFVQNSFRSGRALLLLDGFDELTPDGQQAVSDYLKLLLQEYPKTRVVTTGAPEYLDGLLGLGFAPLTLAAWNKSQTNHFVQKWGELWTQFVAVEAWAQSGPEQVDPILLNIWLGAENQGLNPFELTLKIWGAYAGDSLGPHTLDAIASHIRRLAPTNTPPAALETLAMQVTLATQPVFDPRKAREWVKSFELSDEAELEAQADIEANEAAEEQTLDEKEPKKKEKNKKAKSGPAPTPGLIGKLASGGLIVAHSNNKMRFLHPIFGGFLAGRALSGVKADEALLNQPDWTGKLLAMRYLAAHGDVSNLIKSILEFSRLPMHRPLLSAARWLRDAPRDAPWRGKIMAALAELIRTEGLPLGLRGQALAAFVYSNDPAVTALFRQFMTTLSFELIRLSALGSGALRDIKSAQTLENVLSAPSISARRAACLALVALGTNDTLETVAHALLNADEDLRRAAAEALANDPNEGHAMLKDGATLADILLRRAVVYGLARVDAPWATETLQKMQVEDDQWVVRNSASEVLEARQSSEDPRVPRPLKVPSETPWLIEFAGTQGTGISPGSPATDVLVAALKSPKDEERLAALAYLKKSPSDGVIKQIYGAMYGDDTEVREAAYIALWEIGASGYKLPHPTQYGYS